MQTKYDDNVLEYWKLANGNHIVKLKKDNGIEGDNEVENKLPSHLGAFILSNNKRFMNNFIGEINGFYNNSEFHGDTDSMYFEKKFWDVLARTGLVSDKLC